MKHHISAVLYLGLLSASVGIAAQEPTTTPAPATPAPSTIPATAPAQDPQSAPATSTTVPPPATQTAVAPSTVAPTTIAPAVNPNTYVIGSEDSISVNVWKEPTLSGTLPVRPDGMISLALVGDVQAAGRTPMDLANELTAKLQKFITDPTVTVSVLGVNSKRIFMLGEIGHVGALPLTSNMSILQAIAAAGGLSPYANKTHIYILRGEQGHQKKIFFDYKKAIKDGDMQGVILQADDTIVVP